MTKLNPCPLCGNEPDLMYHDGVISVHCAWCVDGFTITSQSSIGAMNAWNSATSEGTTTQSGKTLRDEFAMAAMQAIISGPERQLLEMKSIAANNGSDLEGVISHFAYKQADEMIKEREK